jgi:hypothetical protein
LEHDLFRKPVPTFPDHALADAIAEGSTRLIAEATLPAANSIPAHLRGKSATRRGGKNNTRRYMIFDLLYG